MSENLGGCMPPSSEAFQNIIIEDLKISQGKAPQEDDITLVVVKLL
jgi:serine phosphatase RsbU (regulator of sigma subunit)